MKRALPILLAACSAAPLPPDAGTGDGGTYDGGYPHDGGQAELLGAHNAVRARAMPAPMPPLNPLTWSTAAETMAANWVQGCNFSHNPGLGTSYGENIYASSALEVTPTELVETWAAEAPGYDYTNDTCASVCGHYTQLVWRSTTAVGCASKVCSTGSPLGGGSWLFWVCDYSPPGNFVGQRPY